MMARGRRGFTLLELLVVLALFALTAAAAVPAFLSDSLSTPEQRAATSLAEMLVQTREAARASGAAATLVVSPQDGRYWLMTRDSSSAGALSLAGGIRLVGSGPERIECRFDPTGMATPFVMSVNGARNIPVRVDGWSGEIRVGDARAN